MSTGSKNETPGDSDSSRARHKRADSLTVPGAEQHGKIKIATSCAIMNMSPSDNTRPLSRYPSTDTFARRLPCLLKWPAACSWYPSPDTTTDPLSLAGFPAHMACGFFTVPIHRQYNQSTFARRLPCKNGLRPAHGTHLPTLSLAGFPAQMACGLLTVPIHRH